MKAADRCRCGAEQQFVVARKNSLGRVTTVHRLCGECTEPMRAIEGLSIDAIARFTDEWGKPRPPKPEEIHS